jgi:hypothetical protein
MPLQEHVGRHGPHRADRRAIPAVEAALQEPPLEGVGLGILPDRPLQQLPLDAEPDTVGGLVTLAPPGPAFGGVERGQEPGTDLGRAHETPAPRDFAHPRHARIRRDNPGRSGAAAHPIR